MKSMPKPVRRCLVALLVATGCTMYTPLSHAHSTPVQTIGPVSTTNPLIYTQYRENDDCSDAKMTISTTVKKTNSGSVTGTCNTTVGFKLLSDLIASVGVTLGITGTITA